MLCFPSMLNCSNIACSSPQGLHTVLALRTGESRVDSLTKFIHHQQHRELHAYAEMSCKSVVIIITIIIFQTSFLYKALQPQWKCCTKEQTDTKNTINKNNKTVSIKNSWKNKTLIKWWSYEMSNAMENKWVCALWASALFSAHSGAADQLNVENC